MALALTCFLAQPSAAATFFSGSFQELGTPDNQGDNFTITNDASSTEDILSVVINLNTSASGITVYDIAGGGSKDFTSADPYATESVDVALKVLTITFNPGQLSPGSTFSFNIDLDDAAQNVTGAQIAGSTVTATFDTSGPVAAAMVIGAGPPTASWATPVPEPSTLTLLGFGLTGLAWAGRRR